MNTPGQEALKKESGALTQRFAAAPEVGKLPGQKTQLVLCVALFALVCALAFGGYRYAHALTKINQLERQLAAAPPEQRDRILGELHHEVVTAGVPGLSVVGPKGETGTAGAASTVPGPKGDTGAASTVPGPRGEKGDKGDTVIIPSPFPVPGPTLTITPPPPEPSPTPSPVTHTVTSPFQPSPSPSPSPCLLVVSSTVVTIDGLVCP